MLPQRLILASSSRYRRDMLLRLRLPFEIVAPDVDETAHDGEQPHELALRLARAKAQVVSSAHPDALVIGSDQVATVSGISLGKPGHHAAAVEQLRLMSGRTVAFHSALSVTNGERTETTDVVTRCLFRILDDHEIEMYLRAEQPYDTAGSAKAETLGISLMESMSSDDPTAIIGLPMIALSRMLRSFGINPLCPPPGFGQTASPAPSSDTSPHYA